MESSKLVERLLQKWRFEKAIPFVKGGNVLDFGGNRGEFKKHIKQNYFLCNKDYSVLKGKKFDSIVSLATIEHIPKEEVSEITKMLKNHLNKQGRIIITTPTKRGKFIIEFLGKLNLLDKENIKEHRHYWAKEELINLALACNLTIKFYKKFQLGMNQLIVLEKK